MVTGNPRRWVCIAAVRALIIATIAICAAPARAQCPAQWLPGEPIPGVYGGPLPGVRSLARLPNGDLILAGDFLIAGDAVANSVARWNGSSYSARGGGLTSGPLFPIGSALAVLPNGDVVVGGNFTSVGGVSVNHIARWNGSAWSPLGPGLLWSVAALAVMSNGDLVAGTSGGTSQHVFRWNGADWSPLGTGTNNSVGALAVMPNGDLIAGGLFTVAGGVNANYIARWNGSAWSALGSGMDHPGPTAPVAALAVMPSGDLFAGGAFTTAGGTPASNVARW